MEFSLSDYSFIIFLSVLSSIVNVYYVNIPEAFVPTLILTCLLNEKSTQLMNDKQVSEDASARSFVSMHIFIYYAYLIYMLSRSYKSEIQRSMKLIWTCLFIMFLIVAASFYIKTLKPELHEYYRCFTDDKIFYAIIIILYLNVQHLKSNT